MTRFVPVVWLLAIGCSSGKDGGTDTTPSLGDDDDTTEETAHTGGPPGPAPKLTAEVRFRAYVAWDATLGQVVHPTDDGEDKISVYRIELFEEGWSSDDETSTCVVRVELAGSTLAPGAVLEGFSWGIDIPEGLDDKVVTSDCLEQGFDASQFAKKDPVVEWGVYDWQLRFGGVRTAALEDWLVDVFAPDSTTGGFDLEHYAAGGWSTETAGLEADVDDNFWYAYAMDAAHEIDFDTRLQTTSMTDGNGLPVTAYFIFDQTVYWGLTPDTTE